MGMKQIKVNEIVSVLDFEEQVQLEFSINQKSGIEFLLGLILLKEGLIDLTEAKFKNFDLMLKLSNHKYSNVEFVSLSKNLLKANISLSNLEYIEHYILKFLRDGQAETEHIDVDFEHSKKEYTLKITCKTYKEFTEKEIRDMIG